MNPAPKNIITAKINRNKARLSGIKIIEIKAIKKGTEKRMKKE